MKYILWGMVTTLIIVILLSIVDLLQYDLQCDDHITFKHAMFLIDHNIDTLIGIADPISDDEFCNNTK